MGVISIFGKSIFLRTWILHFWFDLLKNDGNKFVDQMKVCLDGGRSEPIFVEAFDPMERSETIVDFEVWNLWAAF